MLHFGNLIAKAYMSRTDIIGYINLPCQWRRSEWMYMASYIYLTPTVESQLFYMLSEWGYDTISFSYLTRESGVLKVVGTQSVSV